MTTTTDSTADSTSSASQSKVEHVDVAIIGAGLSGIGMACHLRRAHPDRTIAVIERRERMGGTWDLFRYPGVRSDTDMVSFGYTFAPWTSEKVMGDGAEIRRYVEQMAKDYDIASRLRYGLKVTDLDWSSEDRQWTVRSTHEASGEQRSLTADFVVACSGYYDYDQGYRPDFPDEDKFGGQFIHPQFWPEDLDYTGKNVVVIGSGATAVTIVPAMVDKAGHVTMLQRSPSYIFALPNTDAIANALGKVLPQKLNFRLTRARNVAVQRTLFKACQRWPGPMRKFLLGRVEKAVGPDVDMKHFSPDYDPWDERLCASPDGDLFTALREGRASIVTDEITSFTEDGVVVSSGEHIPADIVITATGLQLKMLGGAAMSVDGEPVEVPEKMTYKATLLEDVPNFALAFGYTNAPWTLKSDLVGRYLVRLLSYMDEAGLDAAIPRDRKGKDTGRSIMDGFQPGYVQRGEHLLPRQGSEHPWNVTMNYEVDKEILDEGPIDDGLVEFLPARDREPLEAPAAARA